jgi:hypothetical protein
MMSERMRKPEVEPTLVHVCFSLECNKLTATGGKALGTALQINATLTHLK